MIDFLEIVVAVIGIPIVGFSLLFTMALFGVVGIVLIATFPFLIFGFFA